MAKKEITKSTGQGGAGLATRSPLRDILSIRDTVDQWLNDVFEGRRSSMLPAMPAANWSPQVDITENDKEIDVSASLPGVDKNNINVSLDENNILSISGERNESQEQKNKNYVAQEQFYGSFYRSFQLPANINQDQIKADYKDGVLNIKIPKSPAPEAKGKKINIG